MMKNIACLTAVFGALSLPAAAEGGLLTDTLNLPEVVASAPVKTSVELTPLTVSVVGAETIEKSTETSLLPVLQAQIPGMFVSERGFAGYGVSGGAAGAVSIRGVGGGNKVLFMIDGQPQFAGIFGHALPDTYVSNGVARVEVVRGPSSMLYGSNAMGGSVNIITKEAVEEGVSGRSRAMFGSFSTQKFDTGLSYRKGRFGASAAGQVERSNGDRTNSEFWLANEYAQVYYQVSRNWKLGSNLDMTQTKAHNPGTTTSPLENMWTKLFRGTAAVYVHNSYEKAKGGMQAYVNWGANHVDDGNAPGATPRDYLYRSTDYNMGITGFQTVNAWAGNDLSVGVDFVHWGGHHWNAPKASPNEKQGEFEKHVNEVAGYLMMQQSLFNDVLALNGGVRLQHSGQYGNEWVPQAGFVVKPLKDSSIKFSFGKGFRAPNLRELYLYAPANADLKPEYLYNYEVELRQSALEGRLNVGLSLYYIDGKDMIQTQMIDGRPKNMNTGSFRNKGFEIDATWIIDSKWSAMANYSYLHTKTDILYAPKNKVSAQLNFTPGQWAFTLESQTIGGLLNAARDVDNHKSDYTLLNFKGAYTIKGNVPATLMVKVDNFTNRSYEVVNGFPMPGATIMGGVEIKF